MNHLQKMIKKINECPLTFILGWILICQIILISVCNITLIDNNIDCDNAKLFVHVMEMWEQKKIAIPNWVYMTTLEIDCSSLLALPLYAVTGNIYLSFGIANIIFIGFFVGVIFYLFQEKKAVYPILASNLICIPYAVGMLDYFNMMFFCGSQYILKVLLPLLFIAILVNRDRAGKKPRVSYIFISVVFLVLLFITSLSSGIYVFVVGILPIIIVYYLYKLLKYEKVYADVYLVSGLCVISAAFGIYLNGVIMGGAKGNSMMLISINQVLTNTFSCIAGIFELFGGATTSAEMPVLSVEGIAVIVKICFVFLFLICGLIALYKVIRKQTDLWTALLLSVFGWNMFVLLITNASYGAATYEYRYHLIGMIPLICITGKVLLDIFERGKYLQKLVFGGVGVIALLTVNVLSFSTAMDRTDKQAELRAVCDYCKELEVDYVYLFLDTSAAEICRVIGEDDTIYLCMTGDGKTSVYDYYGEYKDKPVQTENAVVVINNTVYSLGDYFEQNGYKFQKFDTVSNRSLYYFVE